MTAAGPSGQHLPAVHNSRKRSHNTTTVSHVTYQLQV
jgi:hypothetical protein